MGRVPCGTSGNRPRGRVRRECLPRASTWAVVPLRTRGSGGRHRPDGATGGCMPKHGERYRAGFDLTSKARSGKKLLEALKLLKQTPHPKFYEKLLISPP